ncbi:MAG: hypothetical protein IPI00_08460 [Flavobacteriales bacterium]|nr:hypothetical protein [Flavobacteriales bacterium]MBK6943993.1 hypothetical protein [Flavobacteriales bacterium]MBK7240198.1 hypothetical protein [Flavobacteriales bacterium]MBP9136951.1 hypothetical protein [Flavobacteriales bacterium]HQV52614.1 heavy metal-binding domain-containing protein [Flavobacteriales bacterium]
MIKGSIAILVLFVATMVLLPVRIQAQCCAGGSGSCIAGGAAQGVLAERQMELNTNFQFINTNRFYKNDQRASDRTFDSFQSQYEYFKLAYGISERLTLSLESGYYLLKKEVGLASDPATTYTSSGIGDLVVFPKYDIYKKNNEAKGTTNEITIGLGYKIPLGSYNDSTGSVEPFSGHTYYVTKPTSVQLSSGAQDLIFYTFLHHGFRSKLNVFASAIYIKKGWNPNGEKLGDYASVALFVSRTFLDRLGITLQARYETVARMRMNASVLLFGSPSTYFPEATGYKKFFLTPQISVTKGKFTIYAATDVPLYQSMQTSEYYTQVGSQYTTTIGLSFRFFTAQPRMAQLKGTGQYYCPMHLEEVSDGPAKCPKCGMDLVRPK